ncbi:MAG: phosphatase PAP2 family protein [Thermoguttaceae bacterium]
MKNAYRSILVNVVCLGLTAASLAAQTTTPVAPYRSAVPPPPSDAMAPYRVVAPSSSGAATLYHPTYGTTQSCVPNPAGIATYAPSPSLTPQSSMPASIAPYVPPPQPQRQRSPLSPLLREGDRVIHDYKNFYSRDSLLNLGVMVGVHAIISNTSMDQNFRNWYQKDVRSKGTDDVSSFFKVFGEGKYLIPTVIVGDLTYRYLQEYELLPKPESCIGEFFSETTRTYLVGGPVLLVGQYAIGAGRPNEHGPNSSHWNPFSDNNSISGHAFIGATPFLVAAQQSKRWWVKAIFYTGSLMTPISRINDDAHYLSQAMFGWYLAYLCVRATGETDGIQLRRGLTLFPICGDGIGAGLLWRR